MSLVLYEIPWSHFCEKARWCLDFKGVPYERVPVNAFTRRQLRAAGGRFTVPVLADGARLIEGSEAIAEHLEATRPDPPLLPGDPQARADVLALQSRCDEELGPDARRLAYQVALDHPVLLEGTILRSRPPGRWLDRLMLPLFAFGLRRRFSIRPDEVERSRTRVRVLLAELAERLGSRTCLVGSSLTLADIAAVSLMDPLEQVPDIVRDPSLAGILEWKRLTAAAHRRPHRVPWLEGAPPPGMPISETAGATPPAAAQRLEQRA